MAKEAKELLLTGQLLTNQPISCCFWDYNNGNIIQVYRKGGSVSAKTLNVISNDYILAADKTKPILTVWPINSQEPLKNSRLILPEIANVVEVCPSNIYLAAGIGAKLYIWKLDSGKLLSVQQVHYQSITCIRFSIGLDFIVIGGEDGMLVVYYMSDLLTSAGNQVQSELGQVEPFYKRMHHSAAITDIHITKFGLKSRFATISTDQTLRLYQLNTGDLLLTLIFDAPLTALKIDASCFNIYVGTSEGDINVVNLTTPRLLEEHVNQECKQFIGHSSKIICMDINIFNNRLASATDDANLFIWDLTSRQILNKIELKQAVTNLKFVITSELMFAQDYEIKSVVANLERAVSNKETDENTIIWSQNNDCSVVANEWNERILDEKHGLVERLFSEMRDLRHANKELKINKIK